MKGHAGECTRANQMHAYAIIHHVSHFAEVQPIKTLVLHISKCAGFLLSSYGLSSSDFSSVGPGDRDQEPEFRENVDKWRCPLCTRVVRNPVQTPCGHRFCDSCRTEYIEKHGDPTICPVNKED